MGELKIKKKRCQKLDVGMQWKTVNYFMIERLDVIRLTANGSRIPVFARSGRGKESQGNCPGHIFVGNIFRGSCPGGISEPDEPTDRFYSVLVLVHL